MRKILSAAVLAVGALHASNAAAGVYTDDLTRCLVKSTNTDDQVVLIKWMFAAMSLNPAVRPLVTISAKQRAGFDQRVADLFVRLITADCRSEAVDALKYEGPSALSMSFSVLGQVATRGLMSEPHVREGLKALDVHFSNNAKLKAVFADAGLTPAGTPSGGR